MVNSWFDNFCEQWMPGVAVKRAASRLLLGEIKNQYRGSQKGRTGVGWDRDLPYNNGKIRERLEQLEMRDRAKSVYANNAIAKSILQTEVTNVVSDGFKLQAGAKNPDGKPAKEFNNEAEDRWDEWLDGADVRGILNGSEMQRRPYRSARRDGDGGIALINDRGVSKLQHISANKIVTPDANLGDKHFVDGVEVDDSLRPIRYHILDLDEWGLRKWTPVEAKDFVYLVPDCDDDLGVRGTTCYSTVFPQLDRIDGYIDGVATAAQMATVFGLMLKSDAAPADLQGLRKITNSNGQMQRALTMENGSLKILGSKDDVVQVDAKQPMVQTPEFIRALMRVIGMPFDMPLELVAHDMSQVNFASARIGLLQYYRSCRARQKHYTCSWSRIYKWWITREQRRQMLKMPGSFVSPFPANFTAHKLHSRAWDYTDPVREAQSDFLQMDMLTKSRQQICAERGTDHDEVVVQQAASDALIRLSKLPTDVRSSLSRDVITVRSPDTQSLIDENDGESNKDPDDPENQ